MSNINTSNPIALRYLMSETIFVSDERSGEATVNKAPETPAKEKHEEVLDFVFYGENKSNYLFLTHEQQYQFMSDAALDAFTKTLAALKLTLADVAVFNLGVLPTVPQKEDIISFFKPKVMVFLGVAPQTLGLTAMPYQSVMEYNNIALLHTCTFDEMLADGEKKRLFWTTIKTLLT